MRRGGRTGQEQRAVGRAAAGHRATAVIRREQRERIVPIHGCPLAVAVVTVTVDIVTIAVAVAVATAAATCTAVTLAPGRPPPPTPARGALPALRRGAILLQVTLHMQ